MRPTDSRFETAARMIRDRGQLAILPAPPPPISDGRGLLLTISHPVEPTYRIVARLSDGGPTR